MAEPPPLRIVRRFHQAVAEDLEEKIERLDNELTVVRRRYDELTQEHKRLLQLVRRRGDEASETLRRKAEAGRNEAAREWKELDKRRQALLKQQAKHKPVATHYPDGRLIPRPGDKVYQVAQGFGGLPVSIQGVVAPSGKTVKVTGGGGLFGEAVKSSYKMSDQWTVVDDPSVKARQEARRQKELDEQATQELYKAAQQRFIEQEARRLGIHRVRGPSDLKPGDQVYAISAFDPSYGDDPNDLRASVQTEVVHEVFPSHFTYLDDHGTERTSGKFAAWWTS